ncbi:hypothetical protein QE450_004253 [Paenibacillus sp. SORGH_AS306]|uniref:hypothetical protein n=1 Tax=unclassified Paenibacillus TaxID=185978 RepID=UPI00277EBB2C|nr:MULTISPECIES: hypothetical protein [unclassified Paenibacillus]MDQ1236755.1 hypothetical protein [Paenibacillus sp. SORGH_AS_0306]MDR6109112.1 hypothetical protein [Paenibacillus sp. SORGH_AS_0338]
MHPLLERKKGTSRQFEEVPMEVNIKGKFLIINVPHVKHNLSLTGFDYTVRASVEAKLADIYEYMQKNDLKEFDYRQYNQI